MDILWRLALCAGLGGLAWWLHEAGGANPEPLPKSKCPRREVIEALLLWAIVALTSTWMTIYFIPWLAESTKDEVLQELIRLPVIAIVYIAIPLVIVRLRDRWTSSELGLTLKVHSPTVAWYAIGIGLFIGGIAYATGKGNLSIEPIRWEVLLLLVFTNSFVEEFFHRGVILGKLERLAGQRQAILWGGILFGLTHVAYDLSVLLTSQGVIAVVFALLAQMLAGWILGIIYIKTRSLWPGIVCHYLGNWLPSILIGIF